MWFSSCIKLDTLDSISKLVEYEFYRPELERGCYNCTMTSNYIIGISMFVWVVAIIASIATNGQEQVNALVLVLSFWLMFLGWRLNRQRGRL